MRLRNRIADLEQRLSPPLPKAWHRIIVDGQTEAEAITDYEDQHGSIHGDNIVIRTIVTPATMAARRTCASAV